MKSRSSQKGAAVVEFALLALLLLVFVFGIIEFGLLWVQSHYIANAAREGARVAAKLGNETPATRSDAAVEAAENYLKKLFLYSRQIESTGPSKGNFKPGFVDVIYTLPEPNLTDADGNDILGANGAPLPRAEVSVTVASARIWQPVLWPLLNLLPGVDVFPDDFLTSITQSANFVILR